MQVTFYFTHSFHFWSFRKKQPWTWILSVSVRILVFHFSGQLAAALTFMFVRKFEAEIFNASDPFTNNAGRGCRCWGFTMTELNIWWFAQEHKNNEQLSASRNIWKRCKHALTDGSHRILVRQVLLHLFSYFPVFSCCFLYGSLSHCCWYISFALLFCLKYCDRKNCKLWIKICGILNNIYNVA